MAMLAVDTSSNCTHAVNRKPSLQIFSGLEQPKKPQRVHLKPLFSVAQQGTPHPISLESDRSNGGTNLLLGTSISVYQNSGSPSPTNWGTFEHKKSFFGKPYVVEPCGESSNFWKNYEHDIALASGIGSNALRLSLEWSRIMPAPNCIDEAAVQRYHDIFDAMKRHNLEPLVVLHHFVHPQWFEDLGGFTRQENIQFFVHYAREAFTRFGGRIRLWATFNEPTVSTFCGYIARMHPPGKFMRSEEAGLYLGNVLQAHSQTYAALKAMPGGSDASVGLIHQWMTWEPRRTTNAVLVRLLLRPACQFLNDVWANQTTMRYLMTGEYVWKNQVGKAVRFKERETPGLDFIGLNYYTRHGFSD
eukprot:jgi/Botrbrau1/8807/Bobra.0330s0037.1